MKQENKQLVIRKITLKGGNSMRKIKKEVAPEVSVQEQPRGVIKC